MIVKTVIFEILSKQLDSELQSPIWTNSNIYKAFEIAFNADEPLSIERVYSICTNNQFLNAVKVIEREKIMCSSFYAFDQWSSEEIAALLLTTVRDGSCALRFWLGYHHQVGRLQKNSNQILSLYYDQIRSSNNLDLTKKGIVLHTLIDLFQQYISNNQLIINNNNAKFTMTEPLSLIVLKFTGFKYGFDYLNTPTNLTLHA